MLYKLCTQGNDELFQNDMLRSAFRSLVSLASATLNMGLGTPSSFMKHKEKHKYAQR